MQFPFFNEFAKRSKLTYSSAERNVTPILDTIKDILTNLVQNKKENEIVRVLEVSSGTGLHCYTFAKNFPDIIFQPTDYYDLSNHDKLKESKFMAQLESVSCYSATLDNMEDPLVLDVCNESNWKALSNKFNNAEDQDTLKPVFDIIININMIHIAPYLCCQQLLLNGSKLIKKNGKFMFYGPFNSKENGMVVSNANFDKALRSQNSEYGLRMMEDVIEEANKNGLIFKHKFNMPANNNILLFERE